MNNKEPNINKLKTAIKCSEDFEIHWNRHASELNPKSYGWAWDVSGVAYAIATAYCSSALYHSAYEGTNDTHDWFAQLKVLMPKVKDAIEDAANHHNFDKDEIFSQYNRNLENSIMERQRQYTYAQSAIVKANNAHLQIVKINSTQTTTT